MSARALPKHHVQDAPLSDTSTFRLEERAASEHRPPILLCDPAVWIAHRTRVCANIPVFCDWMRFPRLENLQDFESLENLQSKYQAAQKSARY